MCEGGNLHGVPTKGVDEGIEGDKRLKYERASCQCFRRGRGTLQEVVCVREEIRTVYPQKKEERLERVCADTQSTRCMLQVVVEAAKAEEVRARAKRKEGRVQSGLKESQRAWRGTTAGRRQDEDTHNAELGHHLQPGCCFCGVIPGIRRRKTDLAASSCDR